MPPKPDGAMPDTEIPLDKTFLFSGEEGRIVTTESLAAETEGECGADRFPPQWGAFFYQIFTRNGK